MVVGYNIKRQTRGDIRIVVEGHKYFGGGQGIVIFYTKAINVDTSVTMFIQLHLACFK